MHSFWSLNNKKIRYMVIVILGVPYYIGASFLLFDIWTNGPSGIWLPFFRSYGIFGILLPLICLSLACFSAYLRARARMQVFSRFPFFELEKIGLIKTSRHAKSRWKFTEEIFVGIIDGYIMKCDICRNRPKHIVFMIKATTYPFSSLEYYAIENYMEAHCIRTIRRGYIKLFHVDSKKSYSLDQVEKELLSFTSILHEMGIRPIKISELSQRSLWNF